MKKKYTKTDLLILSLITSIFVSNAFAVDESKYSISGVQLGMTPNEVINILKENNFEVRKSYNQDILANVVEGRRLLDQDDQEIKVMFSLSSDKSIQVISEIKIPPINKVTKKDYEDLSKALEQWSKDIVKDSTLPVPKIRTINPTIDNAKKTYLSPHPTHLKESRFNGESSSDVQLFNLNYFWSDLSKKCSNIALTFNYYKLDYNDTIDCPELFAVSIQNKTNIATGREEALIVQKNLLDYAYLYSNKKEYANSLAMIAEIDRMMKDKAAPYQPTNTQDINPKPKVNRTFKDSGKAYIVKAIKVANLALGAKTCGFAIGYRPTKKNRDIKLIKVGKYKSRGNKYNGIKYTPVIAEVIGTCEYEKKEFSAVTGKYKSLGLKTMPFSNTFEFSVYKNDFDEWVASEH
jgi:hypothetical protein